MLYFNEINSYYDLIKSDLEDYDPEDLEILAIDIYTSIGNTAADKLADCIAKAAAMHLSSMKLRGEWSDGDIDYEEGFYLLQDFCQTEYGKSRFITPRRLVVSFIDGNELYQDIVLKIVIPNFLLRILRNPMSIEILDNLLSRFDILLRDTLW